METMPFFEGFTAGQLVLGLTTAIIFLWHKAGVTALNWLKTSLGLEDRAAHYFILAALVVVSLGAMAVTGQFVDIVWNLQNILFQLGTAMIPAKLAYKKFKLELPSEVGTGVGGA